jgi:hypothetical protein
MRLVWVVAGGSRVWSCRRLGRGRASASGGADPAALTGAQRVIAAARVAAGHRADRWRGGGGVHRHPVKLLRSRSAGAAELARGNAAPRGF